MCLHAPLCLNFDFVFLNVWIVLLVILHKMSLTIIYIFIALYIKPSEFHLIALFNPAPLPSIPTKGTTLGVLHARFRLLLLCILPQALLLLPILFFLFPGLTLISLLSFSREESIYDLVIYPPKIMYTLTPLTYHSHWVSLLKTTRIFQESMLASAYTPLLIFDFCTCTCPTLDLYLSYV